MDVVCVCVPTVRVECCTMSIRHEDYMCMPTASLPSLKQLHYNQSYCNDSEFGSNVGKIEYNKNVMKYVRVLIDTEIMSMASIMSGLNECPSWTKFGPKLFG